MILRRFAPHLSSLENLLRTAGPYFLLELIMPGGTVLALLLFYWRRRGRLQAIRRDVRLVARRLARLWAELVRGLDLRAIAWTWSPDVGDGVHDGLAPLAMVPCCTPGHV